MTHRHSDRARQLGTSNRWNQLILGVIAMMAISSPQYVWTLFTGPLNQKLGTSLAEVAVDRLAVGHPANLVLAVPGLSGRPLRAAPSDLVGALLSGGSWVLSSYGR